MSAAAEVSDIEQIAEKVIARHSRLQRLYVDVYMTTDEPGRSQTDRYAVALGKERLYLDFMHLTGEHNEPWLDPGRFQLWMTPTMRGVFLPFKGALHLDPDRETDKYWSSTYADSIGWHPEARYFTELSLDYHFYLHDFFSDDFRKEIRLDPVTTKIDGHTCVRLSTSSGNDQLWLAPALGFALVKRSRTADSQLRRVIDCTDFEHCGDGIWLPRNIQSDTLESREGQEHLLRRFTLKARTLAVNDRVPDSMFRFVPPPGTLTYNSGKQVIAFEEGGEELLKLWSACCIHRAQLGSTGESPETGNPVHSRDIAIFLAAVVAFCWTVPGLVSRAR